jgi:DNA-binding NtrC family response regulator
MTQEKKRLVLLVDDHPDDREEFASHTKKVFGRLGLEIRLCRTIAEARALLRKDGKSIELAMVDLVLKGIRVEEAKKLLRHIRQQYPSIKTIGFTAHAEKDELGELATENLLDGYAGKDWKEARCEKEIKRTLAKPSEPMVHTRITEAIESYLKRDPDAAKKKIYLFNREEPVTVREVLDQIKKGTAFGRTQERILFQVAWERFTRAKPK